MGFILTANGLTVYVWTTWLEESRQAREEDTGWVLILEGKEVKYFAQPVHRTKNFVENLLNRAWIARWRVLNRHQCCECGQFMSIAQGRHLKSRYWRCDNKTKHKGGRIVRLDWDHLLPRKTLAYVRGLRKHRERYRERRRAEGKPTDVAMLRRKPWQQKKGSPA